MDIVAEHDDDQAQVNYSGLQLQTPYRRVLSNAGDIYELWLSFYEAPDLGRRTITATWSDERGNRHGEAVNDWFIDKYPNSKRDLDALTDIEWTLEAYVTAVPSEKPQKITQKAKAKFSRRFTRKQ